MVPIHLSSASHRCPIGMGSEESGFLELVFLKPLLNPFCSAAGSFILQKEVTANWKYCFYEGVYLTCSDILVCGTCQSM